MYISSKSIKSDCKAASLAVVHWGDCELLLPETLETLTLKCHVKTRIKIPESVRELVLDINFPLDFITLPKKLQKLELGWDFNFDISSLVNTQLTHLTVGGTFNQKISQLPKILQQLTLDGLFNQPVSHLNLEELESVKFGFAFQQPVSSGVKATFAGIFRKN